MMGCGLQKVIEQAINNTQPVTVVKGTVTLSGQSNHSGIQIKIGTRSTATNSSGQFQLTLASNSMPSMTSMEISHIGYVTTNMTIPAESDTGEYTINTQLINVGQTGGLENLLRGIDADEPDAIPVTIVRGTITLSGQSNHSGTQIKIGTRSTTTNSNGQFQLTLDSKLMLGITSMVISHVGYVTSNMTIPAESVTGEYMVSIQLIVVGQDDGLDNLLRGINTYSLDTLEGDYRPYVQVIMPKIALAAKKE